MKTLALIPLCTIILIESVIAQVATAPVNKYSHSINPAVIVWKEESVIGIGYGRETQEDKANRELISEYETTGYNGILGITFDSIAGEAYYINQTIKETSSNLDDYEGAMNGGLGSAAYKINEMISIGVNYVASYSKGEYTYENEYNFRKQQYSGYGAGLSIRFGEYLYFGASTIAYSLKYSRTSADLETGEGVEVTYPTLNYPRNSYGLGIVYKIKDGEVIQFEYYTSDSPEVEVSKDEYTLAVRKSSEKTGTIGIILSNFFFKFRNTEDVGSLDEPDMKITYQTQNISMGFAVTESVDFIFTYSRTEGDQIYESAVGDYLFVIYEVNEEFYGAKLGISF